MNMVIPNDAKEAFLMLALTGGSAEDWLVRLYTNDYTPVDASTILNFTAATFTGSGPCNVELDFWGAPAIVANVAEMEATPAPTWENTGSTTQTCYGWYAYGVLSEMVYAAQRFDNPRVMAPGAFQNLDPFRFKLKSFA